MGILSLCPVVGFGVDCMHINERSQEMNRIDCTSEKFSSRMIGIILIPVALILAVVGFVLLPVFGLVFSIPFAILAVTFIVAPDSKVCRMVLRHEK